MKLNVFCATTLTTLLSLSVVRLVSSAGTTISDQALRNKNVTPVLGRGYSVATGTLLSTCMLVKDVTETSFDYSYGYTEISDSETASTVLSNKFGGAVGIVGLAGGEMGLRRDEAKSNGKYSHSIIAHMSVDRYYGSVDEGSSVLTEDAIEILDRQDYVGFFQACGPAFLRSIRRTSEVIVHFSYESDSEEFSFGFGAYANAQIGALNIGVFSNNEVSKKQSDWSQSSTLTVSVKCFGLSVNNAGGEITASSFKDVKKVMEAGYQSMQDPMSGIVKTVEVYPWVANVNFQIAMNINVKMEEDTCYNVDGEILSCSAAPELIDRKDSAFYPTTLKAFNILQNAEHVSKMDLILRKNMATIALMNRCIAALSSYRNEDLATFYVVNQNTYSYDSSLPTSTLEDDYNSNDLNIIKADRLLRLLLGRSREGGEHTSYLMETLVQNVLNFVTYYYEPCIKVMSEEDLAFPGGKMMTTHWLDMAACNNVACTFPNSVLSVSGSGSSVSFSCAINPTLGSNSHENLIDTYCLPTFWERDGVLNIIEAMPKHLSASSYPHTPLVG